MALIDNFLNSLGSMVGLDNDDEKSRQAVKKENMAGRKRNEANVKKVKDKVMQQDMVSLAEKFGAPPEQQQEPKGMVELPSSVEVPAQKTRMSAKAKKEAKPIKPEESEGLSNAFMQGIGQMIPLLAGTVLGGVEGGIAAQEGFIQAQDRDIRNETNARKLAQKDRELDIKEDQAGASLRAARLQANSKLVDAKIKNQKDFSERFVGSKLFGNFTALGGAKEAAKLREEVTNTENIVNGLDRLVTLTTDINLLDRKARAKADQEIATLIGKLRIPITGPGAFTDSEREFIKEIIGDPTKITSLESNERAKLTNLIQTSSSEMRTRLQNNTVEGATQLKAYQTLKSRGYTDEQIEARLNPQG